VTEGLLRAGDVRERLLKASAVGKRLRKFFTFIGALQREFSWKRLSIPCYRLAQKGRSPVPRSVSRTRNRASMEGDSKE
jgi:hypothetical protein